MKIEIDQSGKVEDTAKPTVIAYSNGHQRTILIPASNKRQLQEFYRRIGKPRLFIPQVFALGVFFLIRKLPEPCTILIDTEYPGHEKMLLRMLDALLRAYERPDHRIRFARIGNHPRVHYAAKNVLDKQKKPDEIVTVRDILRIRKKPDERLRACFSTLFDVQSRTLWFKYTKKTLHVKRRRR